MIYEQLLKIIKSPRITEKTTTQQASFNQYAFEVVFEATKPQIKEAVEKIFNVKVERVNTLRIPGKLKRTGNKQVQTQALKKAYVTLRKGDHIPLCAIE